MFAWIVLILLAVMSYLTLRDCLRTLRKPSYLVRKQIKWAEKELLMGNRKEAERVLKVLVDQGKGGKEAWRLYIHVLRGTGALALALEAVIKAARGYPEDLGFRMDEGLILLDLHRPQEALEAFTVCSPMLRSEADMLALATALYGSGHREQASLVLEPWIEQTQNGQLLALAAVIYYEQHAFHRATACYLRAEEHGYRTHDSAVQLAHAYRRLGNLSESEKRFHALLEKNRDDFEALLGLGACKQERGQFQKALLIYQTSRLWGEEPRLMKEAGLCALQLKKYAAAEAYLCCALTAFSSDPLMVSYYALALECQQKWQEAEQVYLQLIQEHPSYPHGYRALAWLCGVGLACCVTPEEGLNYAYIASKLKNDTISWEILSACEARVGNFARAYAIQVELSAKDETREERGRRQQIFRQLRKQHPLAEHQVVRALVA